MKELRKELFGFLPLAINFSFSQGVIEPVDSFHDTLEYLNTRLDPQEYLHPPLFYRSETVTDVDGESSKHRSGPYPRHSMRLPPSHTLLMEYDGQRDFRSNDGGFILHLLGFSFGVRLQYSDWWVDDRVRLRQESDFYLSPQKASDFLGAAYTNWQSWPQLTQKRFTNLLYMQNRRSVYHWDWERFMMAYMVSDGLYLTAKELHALKAQTHSDRLRAVCDHFEIKRDDDSFKEIVRLRNALFHESLWDGGQPCGRCGDSAFQSVIDLGRLNRRLTIALTGYPTSYIKTSWKAGGNWLF